jgi:uncharacterized protein DUF2793/endosialidase-like protein
MGPDGMDTTPNLSLAYIAAAQAQKHVTHNEALRALDAIVQLMVLDKDLAAPPVSPADGARYIVAPSPTGAWSGQAGKIAAWQDGVWAFYTPREGWLAWVGDENALYIWSGAAWTAFAAGSLGEIAEDPTPQLGGDLDTNGHGIAFTDATGLTDDSGNEQLVFHKSASAVNHLGVTNSATGAGPQLSAEGPDPNIDLRLTPKGTGAVRTAGQMLVSSASFPPLRMERTTGNTSSMVGGQQILATSSGNMVDGFGVNLNFAIQDNAAVINEIGSIMFVRAGADNSGRFQLQPYNSGTPVTRFEVASNGNVYFPGVGTTASAANAVLNNVSIPANELLRSTSSLRYKTGIENVDDRWSDVVRALRPVTYLSTAPADDRTVRWFGLVAEEVSEVEPRLVHYIRDVNGNAIPDGVQYDRVTVLLLKAVQSLLEWRDCSLIKSSAETLQ